MQIDDYITEVLMRDLVGHDRRPASFLASVVTPKPANGGQGKTGQRE